MKNTMLPKQTVLTLSTLASLLLLTACDSSPSGAGAGDSEDDKNAAAIALLAPYEGIYHLTGGWSEITGDVAYLSIQTPGTNGTATSRFYDYDESLSCLPTRPANGKLRKDDFSTRVFMDEIPQLDQAELTLSGSTLNITFNDDFDLNNNNSTQDRISLSAEKLAVAQVSDLGPDC